MKLYAHQQKIIEEDPKRTGLFLGTGSGKTRTALCLARGNTLVIAPKTQVQDKNWEREWETLVQERAKEAGHWPRIKRLEIISKEAFRRDYKQLDRFDTVIVDEAHTCLGMTPNVRWRNKMPIPKASQLYEALEAYIEATNPDRLYLCTATIMRSPMTVWAAAKLLGKDWNWYEFRSTYYVRLPMPGREVWAPKSDSETKDRLAETVRNLGYVGRLEDFFDVPDQTFKTFYTELTTQQKRRIEELKLEYPDPFVRVGKRHQVENGTLAPNEFSKAEEFKDQKIEKILDLAAEFPRMIIFAKYKVQMTMIIHALLNAGYFAYGMRGDTPDRGELIKKMSNVKEGIFVCQSQISAGWELPEYPVMVFASMTYSFVDRVQAEGRVQRANNIKKNLYIDLVAKGGVDEAVFKSIKNKKDFDERLYADKV